MNAQNLIEQFLNIELSSFSSTAFLVGDIKFSLQKMGSGCSYYRYKNNFKNPIIDTANQVIDSLFSNFNGIVNANKKQILQNYTVSRELVVDSKNEIVYLKYIYMTKKERKLPLKFNLYESDQLNYSNFSVHVFADGSYKLAGMKNYGYSIYEDNYEYKDLDTFMLFHNFGRLIEREFGLDEDRTKTAELVIMQFI